MICMFHTKPSQETVLRPSHHLSIIHGLCPMGQKNQEVRLSLWANTNRTRVHFVFCHRKQTTRECDKERFSASAPASHLQGSFRASVTLGAFGVFYVKFLVLRGLLQCPGGFRLSVGQVFAGGVPAGLLRPGGDWVVGGGVLHTETQQVFYA